MLELLISSSVLILVLTILRLVLRDKISARLQYALWLLVLVRLLVPVSFFHSPVSVAEAAVPAVTRVEALTDTVVTYERIYRETGTTTEGVFESTQIIPRWTVRDVARYVWYAGMGIMAVWFIFVNVRLSRRLRKKRTPYDSDSVLAVYVAEGIPSPCLFGLFKPSIYLTERAAEDDTRARQIIAHELTHFRHGDMIWSLLRSVCLVVWWFNPLVWLAAALSRQDCELSCDEGTIKALGEDARFDYGRTLVGMAKVGARPSDLLCGAMTTGKKSLKERVARIANAPKMSITVAVIVLIIAAVAVGCTYAGSEKTEPEIEPEVAVEGLNQEAASASDAVFSGEASSEEPALTAYADDPILIYYMTYITDGVTSQDADAWADYIYFGTEEKKELDKRDYRPAQLAFIVASEKLSDDLWAFAAYYQDMADSEGYTSIQFCGRYDGRLYVFRNENSLPDELRGALDNLTLTADIGENVMLNDQLYWNEVERELIPFTEPADIEVSVSDNYTIDENADPWLLEDLFYSTDGWQFQYNAEAIANEPFAAITVTDATGRVLRIMDDADFLLIEEADGSITWVTTPAGVDCANAIDHLLPWARGEYTVEDMITAEQAEAEAKTQAALALLGDYGYAEQEPLYITGSEDEMLTLYAALSGRNELSAAYVTKMYADDSELHYERYWADDTRSDNITGDIFGEMQDLYRMLYGSFRNDFTVGGQAAFAINIAGQQYIMWYDAQRDVIFNLFAYAGASGEIEESLLNGMLALAESVTAQ